MKHLYLLAAFSCATFCVNAQSNLRVADNLFVDGIPALPAVLAEEVKPYTEARSAALQAWHPVKKQLLISTRFGNAAQIHEVRMAGGDRKQLTFFDEAPTNVTYQPVSGNYFLFTKDIGGNEFSQIYRYDYGTGKSTMITNGARAQNGNVEWNKRGTLILYTSTRRNGTDRDLYQMDPMNPSSDSKLLDLEGGGWRLSDWSDDERYALLSKVVSINESSTWLYDLQTKKLTKFLPLAEERVVSSPISFSTDSKSVIMLTDKGSEFSRPMKVSLADKNISPLITGIKWGISAYELSKNGKLAFFIANEAGISKLYIQDMVTLKYKMVGAVPVGIIGAAQWHNDNNSIAFTFTNAGTNADVYEWNIGTQKLTRWTESELGGMNLSGIESPKLINWKSFDGLNISGFLYQANKKFAGKRPVIINIHGGPEGQSLPAFQGRNNYYLNELGVSIIFPNVRGSVGYGKTFSDLDNGMKREESVKDIGALIDWISSQPDLDASRIMVTGGSYGGYMTLASAVHYNDKIRCAVDIVGISNYNTFLKNTESYRRNSRRAEYGDERDTAMAAYFERIAPLNQAQKITKPMFIIQGKNDPRVPYTEAQQMVSKIKNNGGIVWFLMANDEGHGFAKKNNQDYQFYATVAFVKEYLLK